MQTQSILSFISETNQRNKEIDSASSQPGVQTSTSDPGQVSTIKSDQDSSPGETRSEDRPHSETPGLNLSHVPSQTDVRLNITTPHGSKYNYEVKTKGIVSVDMQKHQLTISPHAASRPMHSTSTLPVLDNLPPPRFPTLAQAEGQPNTDLMQDQDSPEGVPNNLSDPSVEPQAQVSVESPVSSAEPHAQDSVESHRQASLEGVSQPGLKEEIPDVTPFQQSRNSASSSVSEGAILSSNQSPRNTVRTPLLNSNPERDLESGLDKLIRDSYEHLLEFNEAEAAEKFKAAYMRLPANEHKRETKHDAKESKCWATSKMLTTIALAALPSSAFAFNAFMAVVFLYAVVENEKAKSLGDLIDDGSKALTTLAWSLATILGTSSLYVNIKQTIDFLPTFWDKLKRLGTFTYNLFTCKVKCSKKTNVNIWSALASFGSATVQGLIIKDTFESIKEDNWRVGLTTLIITFGTLMTLATRYVGSRDFTDKFDGLLSEDDQFIVRILKILEESANDLAKKTAKNQNADAPNKNNESKIYIENIAAGLRQIFAEFKMEAPADLEKLIQNRYAELAKVLDKKDQSKFSPNLLFSAVISVFGFLTYTEKFASIIPKLGSGWVGSLWDACRFILASLLSISSGALYALASTEIGSKIKQNWAANRIQTSWEMLVNGLACFSMFTVSWKLANATNPPPITPIPPMGPWYSYIFPVINALGAFCINLRSCINLAQKARKAELTKQERKNLNRELAKKIEELEATAKTIEDLGKKFNEQIKPAPTSQNDEKIFGPRNHEEAVGIIRESLPRKPEQKPEHQRFFAGSARAANSDQETLLGGEKAKPRQSFCARWFGGRSGE